MKKSGLSGSLLLIGALTLSSTAFSSDNSFDISLNEVEFSTASGSGMGYFKAHYDITNKPSHNEGSICVSIVDIKRIRDNVNLDSPEILDSFDNYPTRFDGSNDSVNEDAFVKYCKEAYLGQNKTPIQNTTQAQIFRRHTPKNWNTDNANGRDYSMSINWVQWRNATLHAHGVSHEDNLNFDIDFELDPQSFTKELNEDNSLVDIALSIRTAVMRLRNGNVKQFEYFDSHIDIDSGQVVNFPSQVTMNQWRFPGYNINYPTQLPAYISYTDDVPGCLATGTGGSYECIYPMAGDNEGAYPLSIDLSHYTENSLKILACGKQDAIEDGLYDNNYEVLSLEAIGRGTGYNDRNHWCNKADQAYREAYEMTDYLGQGYVMSRDGIGEWWCLADSSNICVNSLIETVKQPTSLLQKMTANYRPLSFKEQKCREVNPRGVNFCPDIQGADSLYDVKKAYFKIAAYMLADNRTSTPTPGDLIGDPASEECNGQAATHYVDPATRIFHGTSNKEVIMGTNGDDIIYGHGGGDIICSKDGNDKVTLTSWMRTNDNYGPMTSSHHMIPGYIKANKGSNILYGTRSSDTLITDGTINYRNTIYAFSGNDIIQTNSGTTTVYAASGNDQVVSTGGNITVHGGDGADDIFVETGDSTIYGGKDNDKINTGGGVDKIWGEDGNDTIYASGGNDEVHGGRGSDTIYGGSGNDKLYGYSGGNENSTIGKQPDDDSMFDSGNSQDGGDGGDTIYGANGNDIIDGGWGADKLYGGNDADWIWGGSHNDKMYGDNGDDKIYGNDGDDDMYGGAGNDYLRGENGEDEIYGNSGNDILKGRNGRDKLYGGDGGDKLYGGDGKDKCEGGDDKNDKKFTC